MSSVRRKLFKNDCSNSWSPEAIVESETGEVVDSCSSEIVQYTVMNEGDANPKEQTIASSHGMKTPQEALFGHVTPSLREKDLPNKILVIHEGEDERLRKSWRALKRLENLGIASCHCANFLSFSSRERFLLIFLEMASVASNAQKICSTIRYNANSLNRTVPIIGITDEESQDFSSHGLNDIIQLPLTEESINQILLKWAGQKSCEGMPLTPESPEDDIQLSRKTAEIAKEPIDEPGSASLLNFSHDQDSHLSPSVQQGYGQNSVGTSPVVVSEAYSKPPLSQHNLSEPCYQQSFANGHVACNNTNITAVSQHHLQTNTYGFHQHHDHGLDIGGQQRFSHAGVHNDQPHLINFAPRVPDYCSGQVPAVPGQNSGMPSQVYPGHFNQGHIFHSVSPSDQYRPNTVNQHFIPINPPPVYPTSLLSNTTSSHSDIATSKIGTLPTSQELPVSSGSGKLVGSPAYMISGAPGSKDMKITLLNDDLSKHSSKERIRRERIKESCDQLRFLLPSIAGKKSDMASILEMTVKYVRLVKERLPASVIQEISDNISASTTVIPRKRPSRDLSGGTKQSRPRLIASPKDQDAPTRLAAPLPSFCVRNVPLQAKPPTMVTTTGPMYLPHVHIRPGHEHPRIPLQHQPDQIRFRPPNSPPSAFNSCHLGSNTNSHSMMSHHPPRLMVSEHPPINIHQECNVPQSSFHHKHPYYGNPITVPSISSHGYDMPQQWSFLKLPPIGNIFHSLSTSNLSQGSIEHESSESARSSPADSPMTPPLWESSGSMSMTREEQSQMEGSLLYKGASI